MNEYIEAQFDVTDQEQKEILIAELSTAGYEGFEEIENGLKAFIPATEFSESIAKRIAEKYGLPFMFTRIEETNWNELWESNFDPVVVDDFVGIRAHFHDEIKNVLHELVITPKMSFGTGHHATTYMMIQQMRSIDFTNKKVLDFGTGTGVLAILAEKLGAATIMAIDIDEWSITNAMENASRNEARNISLLQASDADLGQKFDIILANINKNVIIDNLQVLVKQLSSGAVMLLSGLAVSDKDDVFHICHAYSLQIIQTVVKDNWLCLRVSRY
jgi:ribosomal protein L11 methyltransferase